MLPDGKRSLYGKQPPCKLRDQVSDVSVFRYIFNRHPAPSKQDRARSMCERSKRSAARRIIPETQPGELVLGFR